MVNEHIFKFGKIKIFENYAIVQCNYGVNIDFKEVEEIREVIFSFFEDRNFGLIADRKKPYSVNPLAINKLFSHERLIVGAIVSEIPFNKINATLENSVVKSATIEFFKHMQPAIDFIMKSLEDYK